jgi:hypothetical protein
MKNTVKNIPETIPEPAYCHLCGGAGCGRCKGTGDEPGRPNPEDFIEPDTDDGLDDWIGPL